MFFLVIFLKCQTGCQIKTKINQNKTGELRIKKLLNRFFEIIKRYTNILITHTCRHSWIPVLNKVYTFQ